MPFKIKNELYYVVNKNKLIGQDNLLRKLDEITIERVNSVKFLGVIINSTLS